MATYDDNSLSQARLKEIESQFGSTAADAIRWFDSIAFYGTRSNILHKEKENRVMLYENKMKALDNQVLYTKNQLQDRFNSAIANDVVATAARGIRVTMSNILEKHKESAHNITTDIKMLESNARMDKAVYKSAQEQARIAEKAGKIALTSELAVSSIKFGEDIIALMAGGTGGEGGMSFGNIGTNLGMEIGAAQAESGSKNILRQVATDYIGSIW